MVSYFYFFLLLFLVTFKIQLLHHPHDLAHLGVLLLFGGFVRVGLGLIALLGRLQVMIIEDN